MRENGVCPLCGETVKFYVGDDRSRICPNCGKLIDIDEVLDNEQ